MTLTQSSAQENRAPRLSIVTVVWNDAEGLSRTLRSLETLHAGAFPRFEHVVVDSSPELHGESLQGLPKNYPLLRLASGKNGIYAAMNEGARAATGELLWFLNAGDVLTDKVALTLAIESLEPGARRLLCGPVLVSGENGELRLPCPGLEKGTFGKNRVCHQAVVYPRALISELGGFDLRYPIAADFELHLRLIRRGVSGQLYAEPFARFVLGGASSSVMPALLEFSRAQLAWSSGPVDLVLRQLAVLKEAVLIALSRVARALIGGRAHHRLKKIVKEQR